MLGGWKALDAYLQLWSWPRANASAREMLRGANGKVQASMGRCSASEQLALAPVLRRFLEALAGTTEEMRPVRSGLLLCDVVELLLATRTNSTTPAALEQAILRHSAAHLEAYGGEIWKPKFHYALHLGQLWDKFGLLIACWALERKHKAGVSFRSNRGAAWTGWACADPTKGREPRHPPNRKRRRTPLPPELQVVRKISPQRCRSGKRQIASPRFRTSVAYSRTASRKRFFP